jgi:hypothetical protein
MMMSRQWWVIFKEQIAVATQATRTVLGIIAAARRSDTHNSHHCFNGLELGIGHIGGDIR